MSNSVTCTPKARGGSVADLQEIASLLARGYLRFVSTVRHQLEIAQDPAAQESSTGLQIGVDVAGDTMAKLAREQRP